MVRPLITKMSQTNHSYEHTPSENLLLLIIKIATSLSTIIPIITVLLFFIIHYLITALPFCSIVPTHLMSPPTHPSRPFVTVSEASEPVILDQGVET